MSMMVSFVLSFFPRDVLDEILNLIESVSEDFPSYSSKGAAAVTSPGRLFHFPNCTMEERVVVDLAVNSLLEDSFAAFCPIISLL